MTAGEPCKICASPTVVETATWHQDETMVITMDRCGSCGFLRIHGKPWDYTEVGFSEESIEGPRVGLPDRPGREFHMADFGVDVLGGRDLDVMVIGPGMSYDWHHIAQLDRVASVAVSDIENFAQSPVFVPLDDLPGHRYDLVLACEVVEHLYDPVQEIGGILDLIGDHGMFIASTNVNDMTPIERHWYPFNDGHVSYYSPRSLELVARAHGTLIDFRVPLVAHQRAGKRKRYVLFTRDPQVLSSVSRWFMTHPVAPSEQDVREFQPTFGA